MKGRPKGRKSDRKNTVICYPLPKDVQDVLPYETLKLPISNLNLGLLFHRYIAYPKEWRGEIRDALQVRQKLAGRWELEGQVKNELWRFLERQANELGNSKGMRKLIDALKGRMDSIVRTYRDLGFEVKCFTAEVVWRLTVGLGTPSVLDTGMTLHRIFGIPYIPASAVKGLTHHYVMEEKELKEDDPQVIKAFGDQKNKGQVIFLDALPAEYPVFQLDIINPHYGPYYQGSEPPADYHSPKPVYFLTVGRTRSKGSVFNFCLASKDEDLLSCVERWLKEALKGFGIGAKTRAGYGELNPADGADKGSK